MIKAVLTAGPFTSARSTSSCIGVVGDPVPETSSPNDRDIRQGEPITTSSRLDPRVHLLLDDRGVDSIGDKATKGSPKSIRYKIQKITKVSVIYSGPVT